MVQDWMERLRNRKADREKALRSVKEAAEQAVNETLADYDAFVPVARAVADGLLLGTARSSQGEAVEIRLPREQVSAHWLVQGGTGTGKTTWVASILRQMLDINQPFGVVDCKGDLFGAAIRSIAARGQTLAPPERAALLKRLVVVNPFSDGLVPLNVCRPLPGCSAEVQAYEVTLALSRLFDTSLGLHMENILRHLLILLMEAGLSLVEAPQLLLDEVLRGVLASRSANPAVKEFFLGAWPAIPQASKDALLGRLQGLLLPENVRLMLGAEELLDLRGILERGDPLVVFLGKGPGVPEEQAEVLGSLFVQLLLQATYARGSGQHRPYLLAVDEFFHLLDAPALARRFETALTTVRSFGLALCLIHHNFAQLPTSLREIILGNCDLVALFRTGGRTSEHFGDFLPEADPEILERLWASGRQNVSREETRRHQLEALQRLPDRTLYWYDRRKPHRAIRLVAPDVAEAHALAGLDPAELEEVIKRDGWNRGRAGVSRVELKAQIEARRKRLRELLHPPARAAHAPRAKDEAPGNSTTKKGGKPKLG